MDSQIAIRGAWDRVRYAVSFELILIAATAAILMQLSDRPFVDTGGLAVTMSVIALILNLAYNYVFDRIDVRYKRIPTERSTLGRIVHAAGFEFSLVIVNLPLIIVWMNWEWWQALAFDFASTAIIVVYTYLFTLVYDRLFPVRQPKAV